MTGSHLIVTLYGLFLLSGAFFGFKSGSRVSLVMGLISGALVLIGAMIINNNPIQGYGFVAGIGFALSVIFLMRLLKTKKFMPAGMLLAVSLIATFVSFQQIV